MDLDANGAVLDTRLGVDCADAVHRLRRVLNDIEKHLLQRGRPRQHSRVGRSAIGHMHVGAM